MPRFTNDTVLLRISTDSGEVGYGEANPFAPVTGESIETVVAFLEALGPLLQGRSPFELEAIHKVMNQMTKGNSGAKAGVDIALHDLCAKAVGLPLYRYLGGDHPQVISDMTIGIDAPEKMVEKAIKYTEEGFTILKIKTGLIPEDDLRAVSLIREAVGSSVELRLDANQGWTRKSAYHIMKAMEAYNVAEIEQPLTSYDVEGMAYLTEKLTQEVMADESVHSPQDAYRMVQAQACDTINIKLMKSAGIHPALKICSLAEAAGLQCMVGCMSETIVGIAAGAALAACRDVIAYADLDGHRIIQDVAGVTGGFTQEGGVLTLSEEPGLGLTITLFDEQ